MADLVERLRVRWEATDEPVAKKVNRFIKERKEAADAIEAKDRKIAELHAALTTASPHMPVPDGDRDKHVGVGMAIAAGIVMSCWGETTMASQILSSAGFNTVDDLRDGGVDQYDIDLILPALEQGDAPKPAALTQEPKPAEEEK